MRSLALTAGLLYIALAANAATPARVAAGTSTAGDPALSSTEMRGSIGPYPVGLNYTVRQNTGLVAAHYFYDSHLQNIALKGAVHGEILDLQGADGSVFHLKFIGNGSNGSKPLSFDNSVGLRGSWSRGKQSLPVELKTAYSTANPGEPFYEGSSDAAFEAMVAKVRGAILSGDQATAAALIHYPLHVYGHHGTSTIQNAAALKKDWAGIFTPPFLAKLRTDVPHEMFVHNGEAMLGDGELWFDNRGLVGLNPVMNDAKADLGH